MAFGVASTETRATVLSGMCSPLAVSIGSCLDLAEVCARLGSAPHAHVEDPGRVVRIADLLAGDHGRCRAADVTRLQAVAICRRKVDLHVDLGDLGQQLDMEVDDALDLCELLLQLVGLLAQHDQIGAEDADDDRIAGSGQHLADPLLEIGLHVTPQARIALNHLLDRRERGVVVHGRIDADPVLAEVDAVNLVRLQRLADVRPAVADALDLTQLRAGFASRSAPPPAARFRGR